MAQVGAGCAYRGGDGEECCGRGFEFNGGVQGAELRRLYFKGREFEYDFWVRDPKNEPEEVHVRANAAAFAENRNEDNAHV